MHTRLKDMKGMVLVMVLLVMTASVIIGVSAMRTSLYETRIAGNERLYKQQFYEAESGADFALTNNSNALASVKDDLHSSYNYAAGGLPEFINAVDIRVDLQSVGKPPLGEGFSPDRFRSRYYAVRSGSGAQTVEVGFWKVFPKND